MKYLIGIYTCLVLAFAAQQEIPPKPSIQPTAEALMKAQAANEKAQSKRDDVTAEELKKMVEREIAKSASLPVTTTVQEPVKPTATPDLLKDVKLDSQTMMIYVEGGAYMRIGNVVVALAGSECFLTEEEVLARRKRVQAKFDEMQKADPAKTEPVKPAKKD